MNHSLKMYIFTIVFFISSVNSSEVYYPNDTWEVVSPESQNIKSSRVQKLIDMSFEDDATMSVVIIKNGKIIGEQYAEGYDSYSYGTSWSMAKSFYAALIGISIEEGEINSLDDPVADYLDYFNDDRSDITIRDLLDMSSGLEYPEHQHEKMFFRKDHLQYSKDIGVEKPAGTKFEYNNINSMLLGDILFEVTGLKADTLLRERILNHIGNSDYKLWRDESGNVLTYCCIDMSAREYSRFGLLFARNGNWEGNQLISEDFVNETFQTVWETPSWWTNSKRYYSLHWWVSKYDDESKIFNASGRFGQYIFVDRENDLIFTRLTKYNDSDYGSVQKWGILGYIVSWMGVETAIGVSRFLINTGIIKRSTNINTPNTEAEGSSKEFYEQYGEIVDAMADLSRD
ncbi:MAG: class C beta-lactamase-related serine hydrolase [SAR86 cluster bacterium]|uniref:Class C beta-lactamase-related serine hydrolase n=1 Tax=SAR86 cluster bacterium TaxID=2030880 RepID=A0A520MG28_9GAMM|nr:MAG: class C beta-lactamase-related serine hydrolase [SAR86 cluster bacterium]